jgi:hypothetical protein
METDAGRIGDRLTLGVAAEANWSPFTIFVGAQRHLGCFAVITAVKRWDDRCRLWGEC